MNKKLLTLCMLVCILSACFNNSVKRAELAVIQLTLQNGANQKVIIERIDPTEIVTIDSAICDQSGKATIRIEPNDIDMLILQFSDHSFIPLIIEKNSHTVVSADFNNIGTSFNISEGFESEVINPYFRHLFNTKAQSDSLAFALNNATTNSDYEKTRSILIQKFDDLFNAHKHFSDSLIRRRPSALSNLFILNQNIGKQRIFEIQNDSSVFFLVDDSLINHFPKNEHVIKNHERVNDFRKTIVIQQLAEQRLSVGNQSPDFSLVDINGKVVTLNQFRGKTVLIAFWASWDGKFKNDLEILKIMYNDYKKKGFEIVAVSMDEKENFWKNAVASQKVSWINVSDLKNVHSPLIQLFNLNDDLPIFYLVDEKGIILAQKPSLREIDDILYSKYAQ